MKIALCFFGQPRFLENKNSFNSHKEKIYSQANVDVFTHFWYDADRLHFTKSDWCTAASPSQNVNAIEIIKDLYSPKILKHENQINFYPDIELQKIVKGKHSFSRNNTFCLMSHLYSMQKTITLLEPFKSNYDFIVVSRYDNKIIEFPNLSKLPKNNFFLTSQQGTFPAFTDHLFIADLKFLEAFKMFDRIKQLSKQVVGCCPEEYKFNNFLNLYNKNELNYLDDLKIKFLRSSIDN